MGKKYSNEAIELCRELYCKYGGTNYDAIQREMRKVFPGWSKMNLSDRTEKGRGDRLGWITLYGYERSLKLQLERLTEKVNDDEQGLYIDIKAVRQRLGKTALGEAATKDDLAKYRDFCKLEIEARRNLNLTKDNLETFVSGYEKLLIWLGEIDASGKAVKELLKHRKKLIEMAQAHYGKPEEINDGAGPGEDEGGERSGGDLGSV